jgi:Fe-S oxidoreductase
MATRNEKDTTRARANILREFLTHSGKVNRFDHQEIYEVMDLCLSCKGCKSECPSNVDVAKLKAEFLQQYYDANGVPFRSRLIANFSRSAQLGAVFPRLYNFMITNNVTGTFIKKMAGFAVKRSLPTLHQVTLRAWFKKHQRKNVKPPSGTAPLPAAGRKVYLFCDEFTNYNDTEIGIKTILFLEQLGYEIRIPPHAESGRAWLSKGLIRKGREIAHKNIGHLAPLISEQTPLIGIEPSAILTFRDEYIDLADDDHLEKAKRLAKHVFLVDEFIAAEIDNGTIRRELFTTAKKTIQLHGHCQQKALSSITPSVKILSFPENYTVKTIPSGCCGMAGSFGYEKEHFKLSEQIAEMVLFPAIRKEPEDVIIAAPGTSCRHQIKDGTGRKAFHPVEILFDALRK